MIIICDAHEPSSIIHQLSAKFPEMLVAELGLSSGDLFAQLSNGICICERKSVDDFTASMQDERVFEQSQVIPTLARFAFLILDGEFQWSSNDRLMTVRRGTGWSESGWTRESIEMAKTRIQANGMIWVETAGKSYADRVASLLEWCENKADCGHAHHKQRIAFNPFEDQTKQRRINFLSQLPGVGFDRASNLIEFMPQAKLYQLLQYAANFDPKQEHPKLWGQGTKQSVRELFEMQENQVLKVE